MDLTKLIRIIDGTQQIRIIPYNSRKALYEGTAYACMIDTDRKVLAMYTTKNILVLEVEY